MKKLLFVCIVLFCTLLVDARAPLESYKRYMIVLVHGIGANTLSPHDYIADPKKEEVEKNRENLLFGIGPRMIWLMKIGKEILVEICKNEAF